MRMLRKRGDRNEDVGKAKNSQVVKTIKKRFVQQISAQRRCIKNVESNL
jgi:hypothetical protein